jgi:hypothetical protein
VLILSLNDPWIGGGTSFKSYKNLARFSGVISHNATSRAFDGVKGISRQLWRLKGHTVSTGVIYSCAGTNRHNVERMLMRRATMRPSGSQAMLA